MALPYSEYVRGAKNSLKINFFPEIHSGHIRLAGEISSDFPHLIQFLFLSSVILLKQSLQRYGGTEEAFKVTLQQEQ